MNFNGLASLANKPALNLGRKRSDRARRILFRLTSERLLVDLESAIRTFKNREFEGGGRKMDLKELFKNVEAIADNRYDGDMEISRCRGSWKISFKGKNPYGNGFFMTEVAEGQTIEKALQKACEVEITKVENDLGKARELIQMVRLKK